MSTSSYDIRSGRVAYVTLCARARMFGHAEAELRLCTDQSEHCSLGVQALDDPASTRHLMRSIQDSASPFLDSRGGVFDAVHRSEEHTSVLHSLMSISYADFCL